MLQSKDTYRRFFIGAKRYCPCPFGASTLVTLRERLRVEDMAAILKAPTSQARLLGKYGVELLAPCYREYHPELGEISSYSPGFKENGSVFCHNNPWIVCGGPGPPVLERGPDRAFEILPLVGIARFLIENRQGR